MSLKTFNTSLSKIKTLDNLSMKVQFFSLYDHYFDKYTTFVRSTGERKRISEIASISNVNNIKEGDILIYNTVFGTLKIRLAEKQDIEKSEENRNRNGVSKIILNDKKIDSNYIISYFSQKEVQQYLSLYIKGNYGFKYISNKELLKLYIPLGSDKIKYGVNSLEISDINAHIDILGILFKEYKESIKYSLEIAEIVLMGSIAENIITQELLKNDVKIGHINQYQGLGKLIQLSEIEMVFIDKNNPQKEKEIKKNFQNINKARNLLHPKKHLEEIKNKATLVKEAKESFQYIIKEFNLDL